MNLPQKIMHIITDLNVGGAEMNLIKLLSNIRPADFQHEVITLRGSGALQPKIEALGIPVYSLGMSPNFPESNRAIPPIACIFAAASRISFKHGWCMLIW
jgi:hypothetical protein